VLLVLGLALVLAALLASASLHRAAMVLPQGPVRSAGEEVARSIHRVSATLHLDVPARSLAGLLGRSAETSAETAALGGSTDGASPAYTADTKAATGEREDWLDDSARLRDLRRGSPSIRVVTPALPVRDRERPLVVWAAGEDEARCA